tara:strand:- start:59 stop:184 length:126 start_codon:yes stop_codon:yes gene_type:complete
MANLKGVFLKGLKGGFLPLLNIVFVNIHVNMQPTATWFEAT